MVDHPEGFVVFVPGVWTGDAGEFELIQKQKRYALGRLIRLTEKSPHRTEPFCSLHGTEEKSCGGCPWMMVSYEAQVAQKESYLRTLLERSGLGATTLQPLWPSTKIKGYRNRAQFKTDGKVLGYVSPVNHQILDVPSCPILSPKNQATLKELRELLPQSSWQPAGEKPWLELNINESVEASHVVPGKELGFLQGNSEQNERMKTWLKGNLSQEARQGRRAVLELFCGSGNFTRAAAEVGFEKIVAVEGSPEAAKVLQNLALPGVSAHTVNLYSSKALSKVSQLLPETEVLMLDPPRTGLEGLNQWARSFPQLKTVLYISCNPITFVRDAKALLKEGFTLGEVRPLDLFPHTPHMELMAKLHKK